jgi:hypothetical protein
MASPVMLILIETAINRGMRILGGAMEAPHIDAEVVIINSRAVYITHMECIEAGQDKDAIAKLVNNKLDNIGVVK